MYEQTSGLLKKAPRPGALLYNHVSVADNIVLYAWKCWEGEFYVVCFIATIFKKGTLGIRLGNKKE